MLTEQATQTLKKNSKRGGLAIVGAILGFLGNAQFVNSYEDGYKQALVDVDQGKVSKIIYQRDVAELHMIDPRQD